MIKKQKRTPTKPATKPVHTTDLAQVTGGGKGIVITSGSTQPIGD